jgi:uncharacterized lipoprotein YbaY
MAVVSGQIIRLRRAVPCNARVTASGAVAAPDDAPAEALGQRRARERVTLVPALRM